MWRSQHLEYAKVEPTKAEKQIAIKAAKKIQVIIPLNVYESTPRNTTKLKAVWRIMTLREGYLLDFPTEYEAALYVLKQELMR